MSLCASPPDKGPEEGKKTDNGEMYVDVRQRKAGGRESGDVEITLTISCTDLRKLERIVEAIADV